MSIGIAVLAVLISAEVIAKWVATYQRAPWCWCGCLRELHRHHHHGRYCGHCGWKVCPRFRAPIIRRRITA